MYILGLSSDATVLTPNTESSCDLMTKTKSTSGNDDSTSLDLEWEDEEGILCLNFTWKFLFNLC